MEMMLMEDNSINTLIIFCKFLSPSPSGAIWTPNLRIDSQVLYHSATMAGIRALDFNIFGWMFYHFAGGIPIFQWAPLINFCKFLCPSASGGIWTPNLRIVSQVFYHCATRAGIQALNLKILVERSATLLLTYLSMNIINYFCAIVSLPVPVEGFEPQILGLTVKCSTTLIPWQVFEPLTLIYLVECSTTMLLGECLSFNEHR
jgi:hypothetical protein